MQAADIRAQIDRIPRRVFALFVASDVFWFAAYAAASAAGLYGTKLFNALDLNMEANPPTWYAASQLLVIGIVMLVLAVRPLSDEPRMHPLRRLFLAGGVVFTFLSADESGVIHERLSGLGHMFSWIPSVGGNVWVLVYGALGIAGIVLLAKPLAYAWREWRPEMLVALAGIGVILAGAVGLEFLSYGNETSWWYAADVGLEELTEMLGASLMLLAVLRVLARTAGAVLESAVTDESAYAAEQAAQRASGTARG